MDGCTGAGQRRLRTPEGQHDLTYGNPRCRIVTAARALVTGAKHRAGEKLLYSCQPRLEGVKSPRVAVALSALALWESSSPAGP